MRTQSAYQRVVETTRTEYNGGPRMPRQENYEADDCRYAHVMRMIRAGKCDEEIADAYPEFYREGQMQVLAVCRKIADGTICAGHIITNDTKPIVYDALAVELLAAAINGESPQETAQRLGISVNEVLGHTNGWGGLAGRGKRGRKRGD